MNTRLATKTKAAIIAAAISLLALAVGLIWMMTPHGSSNDSAASKQPAKAPVSEHVLDKRSVTKLDNAVQDAVELNRESFRASFNARPSYQTDETGPFLILTVRHGMPAPTSSRRTAWAAGRSTRHSPSENSTRIAPSPVRTTLRKKH